MSRPSTFPFNAVYDYGYKTVITDRIANNVKLDEWFESFHPIPGRLISRAYTLGERQARKDKTCSQKK